MGSKNKGMTPVRIVLDTNCLVSALVFPHGKAGRLRLAWQRGEIVPLVCRETISELIRVLGYPKFRLAKHDIETLLSDLLPWAETVDADFNLVAVVSLQDKDDEIFIRLAHVAAATFLVSGDKHLLDLRGTFPDVNIISLTEFMTVTGLINQKLS